jgi:hypothetical protein
MDGAAATSGARGPSGPVELGPVSAAASSYCTPGTSEEANVRAMLPPASSCTPPNHCSGAPFARSVTLNVRRVPAAKPETRIVRGLAPLLSMSCSGRRAWIRVTDALGGLLLTPYRPVTVSVAG